MSGKNKQKEAGGNTAAVRAELSAAIAAYDQEIHGILSRYMIAEGSSTGRLVFPDRVEQLNEASVERLEKIFRELEKLSGGACPLAAMFEKMFVRLPNIVNTITFDTAPPLGEIHIGNKTCAELTVVVIGHYVYDFTNRIYGLTIRKYFDRLFDAAPRLRVDRSASKFYMYELANTHYMEMLPATLKDTLFVDGGFTREEFDTPMKHWNKKCAAAGAYN